MKCFSKILCFLCGREFKPTTNTQKCCKFCKEDGSYRAYRLEYQRARRRDPNQKLKDKQYRKVNLEKQRQYCRQWNVDHNTVQLEKKRIYRLKNRDEINRKQRLRKHNRKITEESRRKSREREAKRRAQVGDLTKEIEEFVYARNRQYNGGVLRCYLCGQIVEWKDRNLDHIVPICRGGTHDLDNLEITHSWCNLTKGRRTEIEYVSSPDSLRYMTIK